MRPHSPSLPSAVLLLTLMLSACAVGPDYVRPAPPPGATLAFKEDGPWRQAGSGAAIEAGAWWTAFGDPVLNALVDEATQANQTLAAAQAQ